MHGSPAEAVDVRLFRIGGHREMLVFATTNADGRTDEPLLEGDHMTTGSYELEFGIGDYFRRCGAEQGSPAFLDTVVIRFSVDGDEHYHVPLLASPWAYSTYRGS